MECDVATMNNTKFRCPKNTAFVPVVMEGVYILFASILMLNLLIAKFSYTFKEIQVNVHQVWCFQRYGAIKEYHDRPPVPPPFNIIYHIIQGCVSINNKIGNGKKGESYEEQDNPFHKDYPEPLNSELIIWEHIRAKEYVRQIDKQQSQENRRQRDSTRDERMDTLEKQLRTLPGGCVVERMDALEKQMRTLPGRCGFERIDALEKQIQKLTTLLEAKQVDVAGIQ